MPVTFLEVYMFGPQDIDFASNIDRQSMDSISYRFRPATSNDLFAIQMALAYAIDRRRPTIVASPAVRIAETGHAYLLADRGRSGDTGVVAESVDGPIGATWYRFWTDTQHSYGYVDSSIPELGIGVAPTYRGQGIGTALLDALLYSAQSQGVYSISLSVEQDNPAVDLYRRSGFTIHREVGNAWTMLWDASVPT